MDTPVRQLDFLLASPSRLLGKADPREYQDLAARLLALAREANQGEQHVPSRRVPDEAGPQSVLLDHSGWWVDAARRYGRVLDGYHSAWSRLMDEYIQETPGLDSGQRERWRFWMRQVASAFAPANYFWANAGAVKRCFDTNGASLGKGYVNWLQDRQRTNGLVATVDPASYAVGRDLAVTPGAVVHRNRVMELIQYAPSTTTVHSTPILFIQPWINKYYILDLSPPKSLMAWLRDQGFTVFTVSWKNPDASMRDLSFEDYVFEGALEAVETVREIVGSAGVHAVGFCIGGTALSMLMAWLAHPSATVDTKARDCPIEHWTLLASLADFSEPGELAFFTGEEAVRVAEALMERDGYLDGALIELVFRILRADSLIWHQAVRSYLYGDSPARSDVLYWNSDSTRLAERMLSFYLRELYIKNSLVSSAGLSMNGRRLDLRDVTRPLYAVACTQDHIVPWKQAFRIRDYVSAPVRLALSSEGHVAGIVNPPSPRNRRRYWAGDGGGDTGPDGWLAGQVPAQGSWWTDWALWLAERCGPKVSAPAMGSAKHPPLCPAPGTYVLE